MASTPGGGFFFERIVFGGFFDRPRACSHSSSSWPPWASPWANRFAAPTRARTTMTPRAMTAGLTRIIPTATATATTVARDALLRRHLHRPRPQCRRAATTSASISTTALAMMAGWTQCTPPVGWGATAATVARAAFRRRRRRRLCRLDACALQQLRMAAPTAAHGLALPPLGARYRASPVTLVAFAALFIAAAENPGSHPRRECLAPSTRLPPLHGLTP